MDAESSGFWSRKGAGLSSKKETRRPGYEGPAELVWGSWVIEGQARIDQKDSDSVPVGPRDGISSVPDGPADDACVGAFTAASTTEPMLLSTLATALGERYRLRWLASGRREELTVNVTALHGNRVHFETRD